MSFWSRWGVKETNKRVCGSQTSRRLMKIEPHHSCTINDIKHFCGCFAVNCQPILLLIDIVAYFRSCPTIVHVCAHERRRKSRESIRILLRGCNENVTHGTDLSQPLVAEPNPSSLPKHSFSVVMRSPHTLQSRFSSQRPAPELISPTFAVLRGIDR